MHVSREESESEGHKVLESSSSALTTSFSHYDVTAALPRVIQRKLDGFTTSALISSREWAMHTDGL